MPESSATVELVTPSVVGVMSKLVNVRTSSEFRFGLFVLDDLPGR